ncbi:hypothetical protein TEA_017839 [Camellia sinensis var. sinensis]|uniref:UBC core domain-containing protein n=1 Tax=Camellia sinensis var. sinensis TaxID=542762 RepID=A0A4S4D8M0_CAMSN|nr:hypothetical protein TEA_017839 [Camellia sinensis var. sinensis]
MVDFARVQKELQECNKDNDVSGISIKPKGDNLTHLAGTIPGPLATPYEGGTFNIDIILPDGYPFEPPRMQFATKVCSNSASEPEYEVFVDSDYSLNEEPMAGVDQYANGFASLEESKDGDDGLPKAKYKEFKYAFGKENPIFELGMIFKSRAQCAGAVKHHAILNGKDIRPLPVPMGSASQELIPRRPSLATATFASQ